MAQWVAAAAVCVVSAALKTHGKGKIIPLASVFAGAAVVIACVCRSPPKHLGKDSRKHGKSSESNNEGTKQANSSVEISPIEDEEVEKKVDCVRHVEICPKKHVNEPGSCTVGDSYHNSLLKLDTWEEQEVTIPPISEKDGPKCSEVEYHEPQVEELVEESVGSIDIGTQTLNGTDSDSEVEDSRRESVGSRPCEPESNVSGYGSKSGGNGGAVELEAKHVRGGGGCDQSPRCEVNHSRSLSDEGSSSSTFETKETLMHCPTSGIRTNSNGNVRAAHTDPQSPTSCISAVGSCDDAGESSYAGEYSLSPGVSAQSSGRESGVVGDHLRRERTRVAQEERLLAYDSYLADPSLSPSLKKQVLRARNIALMRLNQG